jgi:hypothetical protein
MNHADTMRAALQALEHAGQCVDPHELVWTEIDAALSLLRSALEQGEPEPVATDAVWLIHYDDADRRPEIVVGEKGARARFARISHNWNAHLFVKVASNSRDDRYHGANIKLASIPPNTPVEAGEVGVASGVAIPVKDQK